MPKYNHFARKQPFLPEYKHFAQNGSVRANVVVIRLKWSYSGKMVVFGRSDCIWANLGFLGKVVVFRQKWLYSNKVAVFGKKWMYSCKLAVFGQK